ncbi:RYamide receptor-like [Mercenaria mercenaria]|uniref:RYamide receptor-like n=1 Tax=Mercenaria mercenaria TaxID=6596 RepID=UPI00234F2C9F|nr:RYamide receptor-like [Mercenaria mercenaria]
MRFLNDSERLTDKHSENYISEEYALPDSVTYTLLGLHIVLVCTSLIANAIILIYFLSIKRAKTNANYYLVALAVSDILLTVWCEPFTVFSNLVNYHWIFGHFMCSSVSYIQTACVIQRSFTLVASSVDRYLAIRWPLKEQAPCLVVAGIIAAIWIVSLVFPVPVAIFTDMVYDEYENTSGICLEVWPRDDFRQAFSTALLIATYVIPLLVLTLTYGHIILILDVRPPGEEYEQLMRRRRAVKRKTIRVFLLAFFAYAICWLPIHAITIAGDISPQIYDSKLVHILWLFAQCLAVSNSAISPIIVLTAERKLPAKIKRQVCSLNSDRKGSIPVRKASFMMLMSRITKRRSTQETSV